MALELAAIPLAFIAGVLGVLSPCVWPLIPIVMGSAAGKSKFHLCACFRFKYFICGSRNTT